MLIYKLHIIRAAIKNFRISVKTNCIKIKIIKFRFLKLIFVEWQMTRKQLSLLMSAKLLPSSLESLEVEEEFQM